MKIGKIALFSATCFVLFAGCVKGKPEGVPDLSPVAIKIVKADVPVVGANVFFVPASSTPSGSWSVAGVTDATGTATPETSQGDWKAAGVPAGEYQIYLTKLAKIEEPELPANAEEDGKAKADYYAERLKRLEAASKEIPKALTSATTSDLKITVVAKTGANETIDISEYE